MKTIIIGGGKVGYFLAKTLSDRQYTLTLIERKLDRCQKLAEEIPIEVIHGDGTDADVLHDAGIDETDMLVAVTGSDEENLIICQIAKLHFNIKKTVARINNPKNTATFKALGIDTTVCSTEVIANLIDYECESDQFRIVQTFELGAMVLAEVDMQKTYPWCDKAIKDLDTSLEYVIVSIIREGHIVYPKGDVILQADDRVLIVTSPQTLTKIRKHFRQGGRLS